MDEEAMEGTALVLAAALLRRHGADAAEEEASTKHEAERLYRALLDLADELERSAGPRDG